MLPELPYDAWEPTKWTLHLWCQIVGKIRLASTPFRNHWWNVPLYVTARGLSTHVMYCGDTAFDIHFDFIDDVLVIAVQNGEKELIALRDGLTVQAFYRAVMNALARLNVPVRIRAIPYGVPVSTPFDEDVEHRTYDREAVRAWWRILLWSAGVFEDFSGRFAGKTSPVHLFWHSFDLAVTRFTGKAAPVRPGASRVEREAYSQEVTSFGFWPGDPNTRFPAYYTYTAPEPPGLTGHRLANDGAQWTLTPSGSHLGVTAYEAVRCAPDAKKALMEFLQSGFDAAAALYLKE